MSAKISLKPFQCPRESNGLSSENQIHLRNMSNRVLPFNFPPSKMALWDSTPRGNPIGLHISYYRNPKLLVSEKALRLSYRHAKSERRLFSCFLLGSFTVDEDEEGITLTVDRFDPGREIISGGGKIPSTLLPGDFVIPCSIVNREHSGPLAVHTPEDFKSSFMGLQSHLHCKEALDVSKLLITRAHITYTEDMDNVHFDLHWAAITVANTFESTPVKPLPIIPTALARNLSSHNNIAQLQGTHKCGYLTMDQTRKLLLLLESDPKVYTLPLVGIWLSGITHIHSPQVWSSCLRYMFSSSIKERVLSELGSFLIVLYSRTHKEPEFYECVSCAGHDHLAFQLLTNEDVLHLFKNVEVGRKTHHQFEFSTESHNPDSFLFKEAAKSISDTVASPNKLSTSDHDSGVEDEDFSPRPSPRPHPSVPQVTRIHPSVPELSLVFGSIIEPNSPSQNPETIQNKRILASPSTPDSEKPNFGESVIKSTPANVSSEVSTRKMSKGKNSLADSQPARPKSSNQSRRNSTSSSSLSTPRSGSSPDSSLHLNKPELNCQMKGPQHCSLPMRATSRCRQTAGPQSPDYNGTFPLPSRKSVEMPKQMLNLHPSYLNSGCNCCHNPSPVQCHSASSWAGMGHHVMENKSEQHGNVTPTYTNMACQNMCCSPICVNSCQKSAGRASLDNVMSPGRRESLLMSPCSPHSCHHSPPLMLPTANGMLGLSAEAYQLLAEQDKQLKLLQSQIQRLLEAQTVAFESCKPPLTKKQTESVSTETSESEKKTCVSIAVSTGASLFWNSPYPEEEESVDQQDDSVLCNELRAAVNNEQDASRTSIASSLKAVDICSFAESSQLTERGNISSAPFHSLKNKPFFPVLQRDGVRDQAARPEDSGSPTKAELDQNMPSDPPEKFYQDLMCQVNNLLKTSTTVDEESCVSVSNTPSRSCPPTKEKKKSNSKKDDNSVLKATLKQLKSLGVNINADASDVKTRHYDTADNACVLACINPEAVIPRLNYVSFTNIGLSGFAPNGVDLSMEANAIALKYLSESQLIQLSASNSHKGKLVDSSTIASLFPGNTDKSMVGLSLISPNNMSFATRKYMKRYALIDSSDRSDDEDDLTADYSLAESTGDGKYVDDKRAISSFSVTESFERISDRSYRDRKNSNRDVDVGCVNHQETNKLRNITNEIPPKSGIVPQHSEEIDLPFFKDFNTKPKVLGHAQFTRHPEKENSGTPLVLPKKDSSLKQIPDSTGSVGDILDVNRLRQLPKLF
ncbi:SCL-interrupting locus protein [Pelobates fuscus]|uniref:SCL-interrupting locus protein n=1 Tax=Pelobates fuscus TaxID=191477 RepID=UPI002FE4791D